MLNLEKELQQSLQNEIPLYMMFKPTWNCLLSLHVKTFQKKQHGRAIKPANKSMQGPPPGLKTGNDETWNNITNSCLIAKAN